MKKLLYKIFGNTNKHDSIDENISVKPGTYKHVNSKDLTDKYDKLFELYQTQEIRLKAIELSLNKFAKSIQNLELLFNPSDITNMYFDKSSTLNYLMEYLNNKTKK